ncbi:MAG: hypothetical protein JNL71_08750 [Rhodospirillales bacterium]|nr:hypothetical protein [Rhodospirillales bacterium]
MIGQIAGSAGFALSPFQPAKAGPDDALAKMRDAMDRLERSQFESKLYGRQLRQAANEASARAIKMLADFGASTEQLARMAKDLSQRIFRDLDTQGPDAIRVPQGFVTGQKFTFSLEIERLSFSAGADGSFSFSYQKTSISITAESYVSGLGATPDQVASYFGGGPGNGLLLPEKGEKGKFRLLVPVDPNPGLWSRTV